MVSKVGRYARAAVRDVRYLVQKSTKLGLDSALEADLKHQAWQFRSGASPTATAVPALHLDTIALEDHSRYDVFRHDVYRRFDAGAEGGDIDQFGRTGRWVPRGTTVYFDRAERSFVKVFDVYAAKRGEARFLADALSAGLYRFLCPNLAYTIVDEQGLMRGYAISEGVQLSRYQFERYIGGVLRDVIISETERTGFYFYDLEYHNVILSDGRISLIDLESVLPIGWFGTDAEFAMDHFDEIDVGWPLQSKWCSPSWYREFLSADAN